MEDMLSTEYDGCGRCLVAVRRLSRKTDKTSRPQRPVRPSVPPYVYARYVQTRARGAGRDGPRDDHSR
jgi:hypothetical protein